MPRRPGFTRPELGIVAAAAFLVFSRVFGLSLVLPGFRAYGETLTGNAVLVGTALSAYGLTFALMQLPLGILSDRIGRRPVLILGTVLFVAGSVWAALADSIGTLIAARLLQGMGTVASVAMAAVGERIPEERRTVAMALIGIPAGLGFLLGFIANPLLAPHVGGIPGLFWVTAAMGLAAGIPILAFHGKSPTNISAPPGDRRSLGLPVLSLAACGFTVNYALTTVVFFLPDVGSGTFVLLILASLVLLAVASQGIDRSRATWQPVIAGMVVLAGAAGLFVDGTPPWLWLGGILFFATHGVLSAVLPSQVSRLAGRSGGRGHGIQNVVGYLGTFAAGPIAGRLVAHPAVALGILATLAAASAVLVARGLARVPAVNPSTA
ncbi:MAG TPA: MFS transporter [Candidatus Thermoplasmatota archaeon]|nr:MFS transporter [Candidatus Thermoplasmatota archaeon]